MNGTHFAGNETFIVRVLIPIYCENCKNDDMTDLLLP